MLKIIGLFFSGLLLILAALPSFAINPGAGQAQVQNNMQQMQQNKQQIKQMRQMKPNKPINQQRPVAPQSGQMRQY